MVKIPKFWYKLSQNGNSLKVQITTKSIKGFHVSPAHMDRGDGVGERDVVYVGRYHSAFTTTRKSQTGQDPYYNRTRAEARADIHTISSNIWLMDFATRFTIWLLYIVEFADWNSQKVIGRGCGTGSMETTGYTDSMTYHTGTMAKSRDTASGNQYRYIEGLWSNMFEWVDGCYGPGGLYIILNPNNFSDSSGGVYVGPLASSGYPSKFIIYDVDGAFPIFLPTALQGSDTTYMCDYWQISYPCLYAGGCYNNDGQSGLFRIGSAAANSTVNNTVSARLMELP